MALHFHCFMVIHLIWVWLQAPFESEPPPPPPAFPFTSTPFSVRFCFISCKQTPAQSPLINLELPPQNPSKRLDCSWIASSARDLLNDRKSPVSLSLNWYYCLLFINNIHHWKFALSCVFRLIWLNKFCVSYPLGMHMPHKRTAYTRKHTENIRETSFRAVFIAS